MSQRPVTKWKDNHAMQSSFCTHVLLGIHYELALRHLGRGMDIRALKNALESEGAIFGYIVLPRRCHKFHVTESLFQSFQS